jgi:TolA-binding protein
MEESMKKQIFTAIFSVIILSGLFAQTPEEGTFKYLQDAFTTRNSDVVNYLVEEHSRFLEMYWESPHCDEILFMLGNLFEDEEQYAQAFMAYLKIKFLYPNSDRRNDAISNLNQIVHNKDEKTFREKRKFVDEFTSQSLSFTDKNDAYYDFLNFIYELNIEGLNEQLVKEINVYIKLYSGKVKNADQLYFWIGDIYSKLSDWDESILAYTRIQYISPESILIPQTLFQIGQLQYKETKEYQKSKDTFVKLIAAHPEVPIAGDAQFFLAELYEEKLDNPDEAVSNYRVLVETYANNQYAVESLKRVAEIMVDKKNYEEAIASYHQIFELYPKAKFTSEALLEMESLYRRKLENYEKAIEVLKIYADQFSNREDAAEHLYNAAELYRDELKNKQAAIETYNEVINKFPNSKYAKKSNDRIEDLKEE